MGLETNQVTNLVYDLNGSPVSVALGVAAFYNSQYSGMFTLFFTDGNYFGVFGPDIGSTGTIQTGTFSAVYGINSNGPPSPSEASGQVLVGPVSSSVPEPSTWAMLVLGFTGLGFAGYRKARNGAAFAS
jgi:PEP-CTERM motif